MVAMIDVYYLYPTFGGDQSLFPHWVIIQIPLKMITLPLICCLDIYPFAHARIGYLLYVLSFKTKNSKGLIKSRVICVTIKLYYQLKIEWSDSKGETSMHGSSAWSILYNTSSRHRDPIPE
ncbi:hypothetical protein BDA99DRAFT_540839 [Phascolomyces articulosus]|uniref:Uncharacterized protein n=1 Tax=Phascolomyces articulosus TaxID=60185 RepID=A0AAD5PAM5_9FUNG|nr:hypothetical protein BDA99DRAFT_540839 [Phascolomyces articulosus]